MMRMLRLPGTALLAVLLLTAPVRSDAPSEKRIPLRLRGRNNTQRLQNREQYLGYLRSMLKPAEPATAPASGEKTVAADVARDAYVNARRLCPTDPRLETAVGIALIRAGERTEAMQRLSMAMKSRTTLYPPATELYLYHQVAAGKHGDVPSAATAYARRLGLQPDQYPGEEERERAAGWLGRMMGYLLKGRRRSVTGGRSSRWPGPIRRSAGSSRQTWPIHMRPDVGTWRRSSPGIDWPEKKTQTPPVRNSPMPPLAPRKSSSRRRTSWSTRRAMT